MTRRHKKAIRARSPAWHHDDRGLETMEVALLGLLVVAIIVAAAPILTSAINDLMTFVSAQFPG